MRVATSCPRLFATHLMIVCGTALCAQSRATGADHPDSADVVSIAWEHPFTLPRGYALPTSADLSPWFPPAGDQGRQAACSGWALGYALASFHQYRSQGREADTTFLADPSSVFSPSFVYSVTLAREGAEGCTQAVQLPGAVQLVCDTGCATWSVFPGDTTLANCTRPVPPSAFANARAHRMRLPIAIDHDDLTQWKYHLAQGEPVVFFVSVGDVFRQGFRTGGNAPFVWNEEMPMDWSGREGHIMVCTGYAGDTLVALNSWGTGFGLKGYVHIPATTLRWACSDAYVLRPGASSLPMPLIEPVRSRDTGRNGRVRGGLSRGGVHGVEAIALRRPAGTAPPGSELVEVLDGASGMPLYVLAVRQQQAVTVQHDGVLYTFTHTGQGWPTGRMRYRLEKDDVRQLEHLQRKLDTFDQQADGVLDGRW